MRADLGLQGVQFQNFVLVCIFPDLHFQGVLLNKGFDNVLREKAVQIPV